MNKISENYYGRITEAEFDRTVFKDLLNIAETTGLFDEVVPDSYTTDSVVGVKGENEYNIYCNKLRIHFVNTEKIFGVEVFISTNSWNNVTQTKEEFKVYTRCVERMFTGNVLEDSKYVSGSWNHYVHNTFKKIKTGIENRQESAQFDEFYKYEV